MRLIDADALLKEIRPCKKAIVKCANHDYLVGYASALSRVKGQITAMPTIDAEPVVRCKDCKHFDMRSMECQNDRVSTDHEGGASYSLNFYLDDYCSFGERKMDLEVQHAEKRSDP